MLSTTTPDHPQQTQEASAASTLFRKKVWLPKLAYDALPYFYLTAGFSAFFATLYISEWFWVLPHYLLFSAACLHLAMFVYSKRRRANDGGTRKRGDTTGLESRA